MTKKNAPLSSANCHPASGAALLVLIITMLFCITWLVISLSTVGRLGLKINANSVRTEQATAAAEAGLEYGLVYFIQNSAAILANTGGYLNAYTNASVTNVVLANGSSYTITYTNPTINNFTIIRIKAVGTYDSASRELRQLISSTSLMTTYSSTPIAAKGNISLAGNTVITNTLSNHSVQSGGAVSFAGNAKTVLSSGNSSSSASTKADISQNNASISSETAAAYFTQNFGASSTAVQAAAAHVYTNAVNTNYNATLNGMTNTSIWINQTGGTTATIDSTTTIGSAANPVLLVINGNVTIQGNAVIYGYIYVSGNITTAGNSTIKGAMVAGGNTVDSGNFNLTYSTSILNAVQQLSSQWAKVPYSWNDLGV